MKIQSFFDVWDSIGINLLDTKVFSRLSESEWDSILEITKCKNVDDFVLQYTKCIVPPKNIRVDVTNKEENDTPDIYDIVEIAGRCGVPNYKELALWELMAYHRGSQKNVWGFVSSIIAIIHNVNCTKRKDMKSPCDFNPTISLWEKQSEKLKNAKPLDEVFLNAE